MRTGSGRSACFLEFPAYFVVSNRLFAGSAQHKLSGQGNEWPRHSLHPREVEPYSPRLSRWRKYSCPNTTDRVATAGGISGQALPIYSRKHNGLRPPNYRFLVLREERRESASTTGATPYHNPTNSLADVARLAFSL